MKKVLILAAALTLTACATTMTAAPAGEFAIKDSATLNLSEGWTHIPEALNSAKGSVLTKDGIGLNRVHVVTIEDGDKMINIRDKSKEYPTYSAGSSELKQIEFLTSSLSRLGLEDVTPRDVNPTTVGGLKGVQFELTGKYTSGLNMKGMAVLAESPSGLNIIAYIAPSAHYYDKDIAGVKSMISSARFPS